MPRRWASAATVSSVSTRSAALAPLTGTHSCTCCSGPAHGIAASASHSRALHSGRPAFSTIEALPPPVIAADGVTSSPSTVDPQSRFVAVYTCKVCETRSAKSISRQAYTEGVVLVKCDGCKKLHLFADHLGWFKDTSSTIEDIMREKGLTVTRSSVQLTPEQLAQLGQTAEARERTAKEIDAKLRRDNQTEEAATTEESAKQ